MFAYPWSKWLFAFGEGNFITSIHSKFISFPITLQNGSLRWTHQLMNIEREINIHFIHCIPYFIIRVDMPIMTLHLSGLSSTPLTNTPKTSLVKRETRISHGSIIVAQDLLIHDIQVGGRNFYVFEFYHHIIHTYLQNILHQIFEYFIHYLLVVV